MEARLDALDGDLRFYGTAFAMEAEPRVLVILTAAFALCGLVALWWPARRAASVDIVRVLRVE